MRGDAETFGTGRLNIQMKVREEGLRTGRVAGKGQVRYSGLSRKAFQPVPLRAIAYDGNFEGAGR